MMIAYVPVQRGINVNQGGTRSIFMSQAFITRARARAMIDVRNESADFLRTYLSDTIFVIYLQAIIVECFVL